MNELSKLNQVNLGQNKIIYHHKLNNNDDLEEDEGLEDEQNDDVWSCDDID